MENEMKKKNIKKIKGKKTALKCHFFYGKHDSIAEGAGLELDWTYARSQGSYRGCPAASLNARILKPVMLDFAPRAAWRTLFSCLAKGINNVSHNFSPFA